MRTIRRFGNVAEAGFARSLLESAGVEAFLADENAYSLGPQFAPWGIRLQVAESDSERALKILDEQEGFTPLPDGFIPPEESSKDIAPKKRREPRARSAFISGDNDAFWKTLRKCRFPSVVLLIVFLAWWLPHHDPIRSWLIGQTKPIADGISMKVADIQVIPYNDFRFLRLHCRYLGGDPNKNYLLRAVILEKADGPPIDDPIYFWQMALNPEGNGDYKVTWEFRRSPDQRLGHFIFRLYFRRNSNNLLEPERHVDFRLPYLPNPSDDLCQH